MSMYYNSLKKLGIKSSSSSSSSASFSSLQSILTFEGLVKTLKERNETLTVMEQCCGGCIQSGIMSQAGSSKVFSGGVVVYNSSRTLPLLLPTVTLPTSLSGVVTKEEYIQSKVDWTSRAAVEYCQVMDTDYALVEAGAAGPTFRPDDCHSGFAVLALATKNNNAAKQDQHHDNHYDTILHQTIVHAPSHHPNDRSSNMQYFANAAAQFTLQSILNPHNHPTNDDFEISIAKEQEKNNPALVFYNSNNGNDNNIWKNNNRKGQKLNRMTHLRSDKDALSKLEPKAQYIILDNYGKQVLTSQLEENNSKPIFLTHDQLLSTPACFFDTPNLLTNESSKSNSNRQHDDRRTLNDYPKTFLGTIPNDSNSKINIPFFAIDITNSNEINKNDKGTFMIPDPQFNNLNGGGGNKIEETEVSFVDTRTSVPLWEESMPSTYDLVMSATGLVSWQNNSQYCTKCGTPALLIYGGTCRLCPSCQTHTWPRQDPSIIVSITSSADDDEYILLARSKRHPPKLHTVIAGFVEVGETMEDAVIREALEETGVHIHPDSIQYVKSQPWPFPQSTMLGFTAKADHTQPLDVDTNELVSAQWFPKAVVQNATTIQGPTTQHQFAKTVLDKHPSLDLLIPPKGVVARTLIDNWLLTSEN